MTKTRFLMLAVLLVLCLAWTLQAGDKVIVHHNGIDEVTGEPTVTDICISVNAVDKHILNHGDTTEYESCQGDPEPTE